MVKKLINLKHKPGAAGPCDSVEKLLEAFEAFKEYCAARPYIKKKTKTGNNQFGPVLEVTEERVDCPITVLGFCCFLKKSQGYMYKTKQQKKEQGDTEWLEAWSYIENECHNQIINGGVAGVYNALMASRVSGISDKQTVEMIGAQIRIEVPDKETRSEIEKLKQ